MNKPDDDNLLTLDQVEATFRQRFPEATESELAGMMAECLETLQSKLLLDDGGAVDNTDKEALEEIRVAIAQLKEIAGEDYPPAPGTLAND